MKHLFFTLNGMCAAYKYRLATIDYIFMYKEMIIDRKYYIKNLIIVG